MAETSIEDIKNLVKQEKETEKEIQKAKEEAQNIVEEARIEAKKIMDMVEDGRHYNQLYEKETKKINEKKKTVERQVETEQEKLEKTANLNMDKAVAFVVDQILEA